MFINPNSRKGTAVYGFLRGPDYSLAHNLKWIFTQFVRGAVRTLVALAGDADPASVIGYPFRGMESYPSIRMVYTAMEEVRHWHSREQDGFRHWINHARCATEYLAPYLTPAGAIAAYMLSGAALNLAQKGRRDTVARHILIEYADIPKSLSWRE